ncbi:transporter substrate-binding domain-containing protein [Telmatospirillum sp.]|uniref:transporter substrate-binding domain-containing protein n=1 Tax=Telmatospirillum sp. TaxID=2079197 RepID=UPI002850D20A|nr:transporter substrate-binding domain-containing protein [Telmatospirillum sp.]MDR3440504.1 transporter substrate-binding domain-containing protein [Telmatospirillum sp.]
MKFSHLVSTLCLSILCTGFTSSAFADQLQDLKTRNELRCGLKTGVAPFASVDPASGAVVGLDVDLCRAVGKTMGFPATLTQLSVEERITELKPDGRVDLVVANLAYTKSRARLIDYSDAYYMTKEVLLVKKADAGRPLKSFNGQKISAAKGSTSEQSIGLQHGIAVSFYDANEALLALKKGEVVGFVSNMMSALNYVTESKGTSDELAIVSEPMVYEPIGIGLRKNEPAFATAINRALVEIEHSGELAKIWNKWLGPNTQYGIPRTDKVTPINDLKFDPME